MSKKKPVPKPVVWVGSSRRALQKFPEDVKDVIGQALLDAQYGGEHVAAKVLRGFGGGDENQGQATPSLASLSSPRGVFFNGYELFAADLGNNRVVSFR